MRFDSIKQHLRPYSIRTKRETTINHAFASALAPYDDFDRDRVAEALAVLGQRWDAELGCVYCGDKAETWDHLVGLVKDKHLRGFGHQIGNLAPCCKSCNSAKGHKDWRTFLSMRIPYEPHRDEVEARISAYIAAYATEIDVEGLARRSPEDWTTYNQLKQEIVSLMEEADRVASRLRPHVIRSTTDL